MYYTLRDYIKNINITKKEKENILIISIIFAALYDLFFYFIKFSNNLPFNFISFLVFIYAILYLMLFFLKIYGLKNGIDLELYLTRFDRYFIYPWNTLSHHFKNLKNGIPTYVISIILFIISFGMIVFTPVWNYKFKKNNKFFIGTIQYFEKTIYEGVSYYRISKIYFFNFVILFIFTLILKIFSLIFSYNFINSYTLILLSMFSTLLIPIPGTIGYELFSRNAIFWFAVLSIIQTSLIALVFTNSILFILIISILSFIFTILLILWDYFMK
jgi:hypothetical protein